jgi:hypothetical protein
LDHVTEVSKLMGWIRDPGKLIPDPGFRGHKSTGSATRISGSFVQERHVGELGEGGVRFASTPLRPNLSTSRLHTSRSASRFRYAALSTEFGYESLHCPDPDRIAIGS